MHTANELWLRYHFKSYEKTEALTTQFNSRTGFGLECAFKFNKDSDQDDDNRLYTIFPWWGSRVGASWLQKAIWWSGGPFIVGLDAICVKPTLEIQLTTSGSTPRLYKKRIENERLHVLWMETWLQTLSSKKGTRYGRRRLWNFSWAHENSMRKLGVWGLPPRKFYWKTLFCKKEYITCFHHWSVCVEGKTDISTCFHRILKS